MLNISDNNEILCHFSEKFRNSKCMEFLTPILDKYSKQLSLVHFSNQSYYTNLYGIRISYSKSEEDGTKIMIKEDNNYIGNITIRINKHKNNVTIVDNLHHFNEEKNSTRILKLFVSKNRTSHIECSSYMNYYSSWRKQLSYSKLVFDSFGNLIDYSDEEKDSNNTKVGKINKQKIKTK